MNMLKSRQMESVYRDMRSLHM